MGKKVIAITILSMLSYGCSTGKESLVIMQPVVTPEYMKLIHPNGIQMADLKLILFEKDAPKEPEFVLTCATEIEKILKNTTSLLETIEISKRLVEKNAKTYHWCFYFKLAKLDDDLTTIDYIVDKQSEMIKSYNTLVPIARSFYEVYRDSRYLRWATWYYQANSEKIFYNTLELNHQGTLEIVEGINPMSIYPVNK
jgi:hypothetical protein